MSTTMGPPVENRFPMKTLAVKPGRFFKFVARGGSALPEPGDDPTVEGGYLRFSGMVHGQVYTLQPGGWTGLGPGGDGSRGFRFRGTLCSMTVRTTLLKAVCRHDTGDFVLPEPGDVGVLFSIGDTTLYCASGGTPAGNPDVIHRRRDCPAPPNCF